MGPVHRRLDQPQSDHFSFWPLFATDIPQLKYAMGIKGLWVVNPSSYEPSMSLTALPTRQLNGHMNLVHLQNLRSRKVMRRIKGIVFIVSVLMRGEHIFASFMPYFLLTGYSLWLKQCSIPFRYAHHQAGENPELRTLFYRLARLHRLPVAVIVVFDGDAGPPIKCEV